MGWFAGEEYMEEDEYRECLGSWKDKEYVKIQVYDGTDKVSAYFNRDGCTHPDNVLGKHLFMQRLNFDTYDLYSVEVGSGKTLDAYNSFRCECGASAEL